MFSAKRAFLAVLLGLCCCLALAGPARAALPEKQVDISADTIDYDDTRGEVRLIGNVKVTYDGAVVTSSFARYLVKKQEADFQGKVKAVYQDTVLTGNQLTAWFARHQAQMRGEALLVTTRSVGAGAKPQKTTLRAQAISYDWQEQLAQAQGQVQVEQGERQAFADTAEYRERERTVRLRGHVRFEQAKNEWLMSESVEIDLQAKKVVASGRVSGRFAVAPAPKSAEKAAPAEPERDIVETNPQPEAVEEVAPLLLPGLREGEAK